MSYALLTEDLLDFKAPSDFISVSTLTSDTEKRTTSPMSIDGRFRTIRVLGQLVGKNTRLVIKGCEFKSQQKWWENIPLQS